MTRRSVVITGASYGVGAACARRFAAAGDRLVLADGDEEAGRRLAEEINGKDGAEATFVHADVSNRLHVHNIIAEALDAYDGVDVLAHMALRPYSEAFIDTTEEDFERVVAANLRSAFLMNQAATRQFIKQADNSQSAKRSGGAIVNLISTEAVVADADHVAFAATQGGIQQLTKAIALSLSQWGARANSVAIGSIKSELMDDRDAKKARETAPLKRLGDPEEVAETVHFLASDAASYITGQCIYIDGGRMIRTGLPAGGKPAADKE